MTREECLRRAAELEWLAEHAPSRTAVAELWDQARLCRSLALVAPSAQPAPASQSPG